jgi:hypothetical protein
MIKAVPFAVKSYPDNKAWFQSLQKTLKLNQQDTFKAVCEFYTTANHPEGLDTLQADLTALRLSFDTLNADHETTLAENEALKLQIAGLNAQLANQTATEANPFSITLTEAVAKSMRKVRPQFTKRNLIKDPTNWQSEMVNISVKYLLQDRFNEYL